MQAKELIRRVEEMALPLCEANGVSLWDVEFEKEGGTQMLIIAIDREGGVDISQCEAVSRAIDPMLDAKEFDSLPSYTLCVTSAGLERKLKKPVHFEKFLGAKVEVRFYKPIDGAKSVQGTLAGYDHGAITIDLDGARRIYEPGDVAVCRLVAEI